MNSQPCVEKLITRSSLPALTFESNTTRRYAAPLSWCRSVNPPPFLKTAAGNSVPSRIVGCIDNHGRHLVWHRQHGNVAGGKSWFLRECVLQSPAHIPAAASDRSPRY